LLVENVTLENIRITYPGKGSKIYAHSPVSRLDEIPENTGGYPEFSMFGELPAWGFYVRHANNITFKNVSVKIREKDYRPAFVFDDMDNLRLDKIRVKGDKGKKPFVFHHVRSRKVTNCLSY
jgi:polygalacturonase